MKRFVACAVACLFFACEEQSTNPQTNTKHPITLGFTASDNSSSRAQSSEPVDAVTISIKDSDGKTVHSMKRMDLIAIGEGYITKELELLPGRYTVEDFIVVDKKDAALYITPKKKSKAEKLVSTPLPYSFEVVPGDTNSVVLDVISAELGNASDFGYATFSFNVIQDIEAGLVAYFPFNADASDHSRYENHGLVNGPVPTVDRFNTMKGAYYFDGVDDYIEVANDSSLYFSNEFSLCAWVNLQSGKAWGSRIIDKAVGSRSTGFVLDTYDAEQTGRAVRLQAVNAWTYASDDLLTLNEWHYVVATFKDGEGKIYINGELDTQSQGDQKTLVNDAVPLRIGFDSGVRVGNDFDDGFHGAIDEVRIYNRRLSSQEVKTLFQQK
jgi:hypothetical protein